MIKLLDLLEKMTAGEKKEKEKLVKGMKKAKGDFCALQCLSKDSSVSLFTVGFHAQQAVEKALKSALFWHAQRCPFTHDIEALLTLVRQAGIPLPPGSDSMPMLSPFSALLRYEDEDWQISNAPDMDTMLVWADGAIQWAQQQIEGDDPNSA